MNKSVTRITTFLLMLCLPMVQAAPGKEPLDLVQGATGNLRVALEEAPELRTRSIQPGRSAMLIDYRLRRVGSGWKVYDVTIEGISLARISHQDDAPSLDL